jgi:diacylglycerol kinase family enzyme
VQERLIDHPAIAIRRVHAVVNPASGSVRPGMADEVAALLAERGLDYHVSEIAPGGLAETVRAALASRPDLLIVLGGDGTTRLAAEMCGPSGPLVAPLSGGTMNKLSHALYGDKPWHEALSGAIEGAAARWVSGGEIGGRAFYCSAVLGSPALWAPAREAIREHALGRAWRQAAIAIGAPFLARLGFEFDGEMGAGLVIGLICPTISRALAEDERALEMAVLDQYSLKAGVRLALSNLFGDWRDDPHVAVRPCARGRVWARDPIPAVLDGEFFRFGRQVEARFRPRAFRALAPAAGEDGAR